MKLVLTTLCTNTLVIVESRTSTRVSNSCNSEISPCYNRNTNLSDYFFENKTLESSSSELPPGVTPRRIRGRSQRARKKNHSRKQSNRRRVARRKVHRHSTRVLNLKPAVILLPPFESVQVDNPNNLDPFIINFISKENSSTPATVNLDSEALPLDKDVRSSTIPPPDQYLLPPLPVASSNRIDNEEVATPKDTDSGYGYVTTVLYENVSPVQNYSTSVNPFDKLEKEYNEVMKLTGGDLLEVQVNQSNYNQLDENYSNTFNRNSERTSYEWSSTPSYSTPSYNGTIIDNTYDDFSYEKSEEGLGSDFESTKNSYSVLNNSLLAPDIASLGMKIVTSKKGLEMVKEFTILNNTRDYTDVPDYTGNSANINLETAETGDFRLQTYDNQILSIEDAKDVPKEAYRVLKGAHKPFQVCSGNKGYVADAASGCRVFYICLGRGSGEPMMCPNGTLFNQDFLVCDWWYNVECNG